MGLYYYPRSSGGLSVIIIIISDLLVTLEIHPCRDEMDSRRPQRKRVL